MEYLANHFDRVLHSPCENRKASTALRCWQPRPKASGHSELHGAVKMEKQRKRSTADANGD